jgi:hypothetical protein
VRHRIARQGGADAKQLQSVATDPALGAPVSSSPSPTFDATGGARGRHADPNTPAAANERGPSGLSAAVTAATHGQAGSVGTLAAGLVLISAAAAAMALVRRRSYLT